MEMNCDFDNELVDNEIVSRGYVVCGFWRRFASGGVDLIFFLLLTRPVIGYVIRFVNEKDILDLKNFFLLSILLIAVIIVSLISIFFQYIFNGSIGKLVFGLKIVESEFGGRPTRLVRDYQRSSLV